MLSVFVLNRLIYLWDVFSGGSDSSAGYLKPRNDRTETSLRSFLRTLYVVFLPRVGSSGGWVKCCCVCVWVGRLSLTLRCVRCYVRGFVSIDTGQQQRLVVWLVSMTTRHFDEFWFGSLCQIFEWSQLLRSLCSGCTKRRIVRFFCSEVELKEVGWLAGEPSAWLMTAAKKSRLLCSGNAEGTSPGSSSGPLGPREFPDWSERDLYICMCIFILRQSVWVWMLCNGWFIHHDVFVVFFYLINLRKWFFLNCVFFLLFVVT